MDQKLKEALMADAHAEDDRLAAIELAILCAKDVVDYWPQFSFRTIRIMAAKMDTLRQALETAKK
jgi:hypothetical protein